MIFDWIRSRFGSDFETGIELEYKWRCYQCGKVRDRDDILFVDDEKIAHCSECDCEHIMYTAYPSLAVHVRR